MNHRSRALFALLPALFGARAACEEPDVHEWAWRPALYALATFDDTTGAGAGAVDGELQEPSPGLGLGATLDGGRAWSRGSFETNLLALTRSPYSRGEGSLSVVGRLHATHDLSRVRLTIADEGKLQRHAGGFATDFQRNELQAGARFLSRDWDLGAFFTDRRRTVEDVPQLGFDFQTLSLGLAARPARRLSLQLEAGLERAHARTARGERWRVAFEAVRVHRTGVVALRALYLDPRDRQPAARAGAAPGVDLPVLPPGPGQGAVLPTPAYVAFLEAVAAAAPLTAVGASDALSDTLWLDPLAEDADEWDFGRRRLALAAFGSRRVGERVALALRLHYVHRRGPDLLQPVPTPVFQEQRFELRAGANVRLGRRTALLVQASYLRSDADRAAFDYRRLLAAAGIQVGF